MFHKGKAALAISVFLNHMLACVELELDFYTQ